MAHIRSTTGHVATHCHSLWPTMVGSIHRTIFSTRNCFVKIRFRTSVIVQAPTTLLIVIQFPLSTPLIAIVAILQLLEPSFLLLPSQKPFTTFHRSYSIGQTIRFFIVFPAIYSMESLRECVVVCAPVESISQLRQSPP